MDASVKPQPELKKRKLSLRQWQQPKTRLGQWGELQARQFLKLKKYIILASNLACKWGEIDLVAFDTQLKELVFCEVKTRSSTQFGYPSQAVNHQKLARMKKIARIYLHQHQHHCEYRFDVISVSAQGIDHQVNVTL